jgi:hypothetical protein
MLPNSYQPGDNFFSLQARIVKRIQTTKSAEVLALFQTAYQAALDDENLILSRVEKEKLFKRVLQESFEDLLKKL